MPTTLTNGIQLPDKGSVDWYSSMQSNYNLIDTHLGDTDVHVTAEDKANWNSKQGSLSQAQLDAIAQVATNTDDIATLQSDKADASHTHSSSDITDIDDYATKDYVDTSISGLVDNAPDALNTLNELSAALNDDSNFATTVTNALANKADSADLATVATSGDYNDLDNLPTIPTKTSDLSNDSDFVVSSTLAAVATSGDYDDLSNKPSIPTNTSDLNNDSGFVTLNDFDIPSKTSDLTNDSGFITSSDVPTSTSDLINDSNFVDTSNPAVASGITSAKVTDYDTHVADTDIHVTASDKTTWNTVTSKANDSNVVHKSGSETISGDKVFNNRLIKNIDVELGTAPSTTKFGTIEISDNNKTTLLQVMGGVYANGQSYARFAIQNKMADDGTGLSPTGTLRACGFNISLPANSTSEGQGSITPRANKTTDFGLSSYQWRNVWCEKLYLNGTQLDPSAFVTTDTIQTINGNKTFSGNLYVYNSDASTDPRYLILRNPKVKRGSTTETGTQFITFHDKDGGTLVSYDTNVLSSGNTQAYINVSNIDANSQRVLGGVKVVKTPTETWFVPDGNNSVSSGLSNFRWSDVQTYKVNALEPSSLSLPSDRSARIDISSYFTNTGSTSTNDYSVPVNGYISLNLINVNAINCYSLDESNTTNYAQSYYRPVDGQIYIFFPVRKNDIFRTFWITSGTVTVTSAYFIPCQGNV